MPGVGKVNEFILKGLGLNVCSDVTQGEDFDNACKIFINFSEAAFDFLFKTCSGIAADQHDSSQRKVIGIAHAVVPTNSPHILLESLDLMCEELEHICIQNRVSAKTLTLEVKNEKFRQKQK